MSARASWLCSFVMNDWMSNAEARTYVCVYIIAGGSCSFGSFALLVLCDFFFSFFHLSNEVIARSAYVYARLRLVLSPINGHTLRVYIVSITFQCVRVPFLFILYLSRGRFHTWRVFLPSNHWQMVIIFDNFVVQRAFAWRKRCAFSLSCLWSWLWLCKWWTNSTRNSNGRTRWS